MSLVVGVRLVRERRIGGGKRRHERGKEKNPKGLSVGVVNLEVVTKISKLGTFENMFD